MEQSPRLSLSYVAPSQAQKHVTVNESFRRLDTLTQLSVLSRTIAAEPGAPTEGDAYILPSGSSGAAWDNYSVNNIAVFQDGAWAEIAAFEGLRAWVSDDEEFIVFDGASWNEIIGAASGVAQFGVNATADSANRLSVKSDAILFSHDDVTPGSGDAQVKINKAAAGDTASHLFQTNFSGRAEFGLTGDDDFHIKISADGSSWIEGVIIDKDDGYVSFAGHVGFGGSAPSSAYSANFSSAGAAISGASVLRSSSGALRLGDSAGWSSVDLRPGGAKNVVVSSGGGVTVGNPTGGDKGAGSVNAQAVYDDNALLTCYVFDQALDGAISTEKWDRKVPDRKIFDRDPETGVVRQGATLERIHEPLRKFTARIGGDHDPLTLDGYARHWREKRHLTSLPNEAAFDPEEGMPAGAWIQRLVETVEIQAVLIEALNQRIKTIEAGGDVRPA
jgi:hypothetical protein